MSESNLENEIEQLKKENAILVERNATIAGLEGKITKLNVENAERRIVNTQQKKSLFAHKQVITKNNIKVDYDTLGVDGLTLNKETGAVEGEVSYNPASSVEIGGGVPPASSGAPEGVSIESIQSMNRADIAKNWDAISDVLANQTT